MVSWSPSSRQSQTGPLTGTVNGSSLRLALLSENSLNLGGIQQASDLIHAHLGANRLVLAKHLRAQAGCRLAGREVRAVHTRLVDNNIIVGRAGAQRRGEVFK